MLTRRTKVDQGESADFILIRSIDRVNGTPSNFRVRLPDQYAKPTIVELAWAEVPNNIYNISQNRPIPATGAQAGNNIFTYNKGGGQLTYTIPDGSYNPTTLAALPFFNGSISTDFTLAYNPITFLFTITSNNGSLFSMFPGTGTFPWRELGFNPAMDWTNFGAGATSYTGNQAIDFSFPRFVYINVVQIPSGTTTTMEGDAPTFIIPCTFNSGDGFYRFSSGTNWDYHIECQDMPLSFLDVQLKLPQGNQINGSSSCLVDTLGLEWEFIIALHYRDNK
jgi:hypothetical protein